MRTQHHPKHNRRHRCSVHVGRPSEQSHHCLSHGASDPSIAKPAESAAKCPPEHGSSSRGCCGCRPLPFLRSLRTAVVLSWPGASQTRTLTPPFYRAGTPTESCYCRSHALVSLSSSEWGLLCIAFAVVRGGDSAKNTETGCDNASCSVQHDPSPPRASPLGVRQRQFLESSGTPRQTARPLKTSSLRRCTLPSRSHLPPTSSSLPAVRLPMPSRRRCLPHPPSPYPT